MVSHRLIKAQRDLASALYPVPVPIFETLNNHARLRKWLSAQDAPVFADRFGLHKHVSDKYVGQVAIDYLEFGVFEGQSFAKWMEYNAHPDSRFFGFDTFTGLPTDWGAHFKRGHFDVNGSAPAIDDQRGKFIKGLFQDTLPPFLLELGETGRPLVIHNDSDLYSSTAYALAKLEHLIKPGTIIIFDEFASPMHEFRAWNDFCEAFMRRAQLIGYSGPYATQAAFRFD